MVVCYKIHSPQHLQHKASHHSEGQVSNTFSGGLKGLLHKTLSTVTIQSRLSILQQLHTTHTTYHLSIRQSSTTVQFVCASVLLYSLGQSVLLQDCVSLALPGHPLPPFCGGGLLHRRTRVIFPSPHVVVHADQGDQRPQFPSARTRHETRTYK